MRPEEFATNVLVIVTPPGNPAGGHAPSTTWPAPPGCGAPTRCPAAGWRWPSSTPQGVDAEPASLEEDVRATLDKVVSGEADAALVYATDAVAAGDAVETVEIPGADAAADVVRRGAAGAEPRTPTSPRSGSTS